MAGQFQALQSGSSGLIYLQQSTTLCWYSLRPPDRHSTWPSPTPAQWWKTCGRPPTTTVTSIRQTALVWGARAKSGPSPPVSDVLLFRTSGTLELTMECVFCLWVQYIQYFNSSIFIHKVCKSFKPKQRVSLHFIITLNCPCSACVFLRCWVVPYVCLQW